METEGPQQLEGVGLALQKGPQAARPGLLELNPEAQTEGRKAKPKGNQRSPGVGRGEVTQNQKGSRRAEDGPEARKPFLPRGGASPQKARLPAAVGAGPNL